MKKGFTLIELLVVVLLIGILASVALPQYTKAVLKSRSAKYLATIKTVYEAQQTYYMANGSYAHAYEDLDIVPSLPNKPASAYCAMYTASNDASRADNDFVVTLNNNANADISTFVAGAFIRGDYACGGFKIPLRDFAGGLSAGNLYCYEHASYFKKEAGYFCQKLYGATYVTTWQSCRYYKMP